MSPQATETATQTLLNLGLPGVVILALTAAVVFLVRQNGQLRGQIDNEHEKRLADLRDNTKVILELHDQNSQAAAALDRSRELFEQLRQSRN